MELKLNLLDNEWPKGKITNIREISRLLIKNEDGLYAIHHVSRNDAFGPADYYETPGGGVDAGESDSEAAIREASEETGYDVKIVAKLALVKDYYNLIGRENHNHFFLATTIGEKKKIHFVSSGDNYIKETLYLPPKEIIALYRQSENSKIGRLLAAREVPIWSLLIDK